MTESHWAAWIAAVISWTTIWGLFFLYRAQLVRSTAPPWVGWLVVVLSLVFIAAVCVGSRF